MARYDEYGFRGATPAGDLDQRAYTATGSEPDRAPSPDDTVPATSTGIPGVGTVMSLSAQTGHGEGTSPQQPGQSKLGITGADGQENYVNTGAGHGSPVAADRYPWQSKAGA